MDVEELLQELAPKWVIQRIDRTFRRYESLPDIEISSRPELKIDCKYTVGFFSFKDLEKMLLEVEEKYCSGGLHNSEKPVIIYGERKGKTRINKDNIGVCVRSKYGIMCMPLQAWVKALEGTR